MTRVVNIGTEKYDVYIGRPGYFGNPYRLARERFRQSVVEQYRTYFLHRVATDPKFRERILALRGKVLGCYCAPKACHGDVIAVSPYRRMAGRAQPA